MQLLKVDGCLQGGGPVESDYDSQGSESDHSERDPDSQVSEQSNKIHIFHNKHQYDLLSTCLQSGNFSNYLLKY